MERNSLGNNDTEMIMPRLYLALILGSVSAFLGTMPGVQALPPPDELPEEVLRSEIILDARSTLDGEPLTAAEYVQERQALAESAYAPELDSEIQHAIFLLQIRQALKPLLPFIP
ncbi:MAG: hypothetical protein ACPGVO_21180 [Spirulinaceae cyanobacterium]